MDTVLIVKAVIVITIFAISMLMALYETYAERVIAAFIQDRVGPDRAGPYGLLQPLADGAKLFFKEDFIFLINNTITIYIAWQSATNNHQATVSMDCCPTRRVVYRIDKIKVSGRNRTALDRASDRI